MNKIISIKDEDSGIRSKHSWGSNTLLNQKLIQWEIYHCSYLQIIILFSLTILPFHGNTLSKIVFSSSLWFVLQIPTGTEINGKQVPRPPSDPRPSRVVLSMEAIIILMNMLDAHLQRNWLREDFGPFVYMYTPAGSQMSLIQMSLILFSKEIIIVEGAIK